MKEGYKYIIKSDGTKREIEYQELNQLKKDILWIYDENICEINCAFAPSYSFKLKYWEYLSLNGDKWFNIEEKQFYKVGALITLLCFCIQYIDIASGDQKVFNKSEIPTIKKYVENYIPNDVREKRLKDKILLGLKIANSMTETQLQNTDFVHELTDEFYINLKKIGDDFIVSYYEQKLKTTEQNNA